MATRPHVEEKAKSKRREEIIKVIKEKIRKKELPKRPNISKLKAYKK